MTKPQESILHSPDFLRGLRESYKYFFYAALLDNRHTQTEIPVSTIIANMVLKAWPVVVEHRLSLGTFDQLEVICLGMCIRTNSSETPDLSDVLAAIENDCNRKSVNDIIRVFARFADSWVGRVTNIDNAWLHSEYYTTKCFFPYHFSSDESDSILINPKWAQYIDDNPSLYEVYINALDVFLRKRNRNSGKSIKAYINQLRGTSINADSIKPEKVPNGINAEIFHILETIPIDFLFREPRIIDRSREIDYLKNNPQDDINYLSDVFLVSTKKRWLSSLRAQVLTGIDSIIAANTYYNNVPTIPNNIIPGLPLGLAIDDFIHEYIDRMRSRSSFLVEKERSKIDIRLHIFAALYDDRIPTSYTRNDLASQLGMHVERVRQLQKGDDSIIGIGPCAQMLNGIICSGDFIVNPFLLTEMMDLFNSNIHGETLEEFDARFGFINDKIRNFIIDILGFRYVDSIRYIEPFILRGDNSSVINRNFANVMKYFNNTIHYISIENDLVPFLKSDLKLEYDIIDNIAAIVEHSKIFECDDSLGEKKYRLKWETLLTTPARVARILFDINKPVHYSEVYKEYQQRSAIAGLEIQSDEKILSIRHPYIKVRGKLGIWEYSEDERGNDLEITTVSGIIEQHVISNGGLTSIAEASQYLASINMPKDERLIKSYLRTFCIMARNASGVYIHKDYIGQYPNYITKAAHIQQNEYTIVIRSALHTLARNGGSSTVRQVIDDYEIAYKKKIREASLRSMISRYNRLISYDKSEGHVTLRLLIPINEIDEVAIEPENTLSSPLFHTQIIDEIRNLLEHSPSHCMRLSDVINSVKYLIPKDKKKNIVYKIIAKMDRVEIYEVDGKKYIRQMM